MTARRLVPLVLCLSALPVRSQAPAPPAAPPAADDAYGQMELLARAMELVRQNYVDGSKVTYERLVTGALRGMLAELDPHSQYLTPELAGQLREPPEGSPGTAGFTLAPRGGGLAAVTVREDGPAARAGLMPGDQLLKIGDRHTAGLSGLEALSLLAGPPGSPLPLTVWRAATQETKAMEITREAAQEEPVRDAGLLDAALTGDTPVGYIRLLQFSAAAPARLAAALDRLEAGGMKALVLDLRNNPGGLLAATVEVCGEFLPPGTVVVTKEGRHPAQNPPPLKTPDKKRKARTYPMALLVNHASASGAELMAGALQDLGRAVIVGTPTFGKGSVQSIIPGDHGSAFRLTTARYYTPKHRAIHETGIVPDILAPLAFEGEEALTAPRPAAGSGGTPEKPADRQLERAVTALKGVLVFRRMEQR